jgi:hypothetical protein
MRGARLRSALLFRKAWNFRPPSGFNFRRYPGVPYAGYSKYLECYRKAGRRWYYRNRQEQLERAARYRQANRKLGARGQRQWTRRNMAEDPTYRVRIICQISWKERCRRKRVYHAEPFLVCHFSNLRPLSVEENRRKNGSYSKAELAMFKRLWRQPIRTAAQTAEVRGSAECRLPVLTSVVHSYGARKLRAASVTPSKRGKSFT